jgi:hypothetical protein
MLAAGRHRARSADRRLQLTDGGGATGGPLLHHRRLPSGPLTVSGATAFRLATNRQPVHPSRANATSPSPAKRPSQARTVLRSAGAIRPPRTSPVVVSRIVCLTRGAQGFDFLGFHLHKVESWKWRGRYYLQRWPSARAMASVRAKIRSLTDRRLVGFPIESVVANLNRVLRGWSEYFRYGNCARKFAIVERYVHERLAIFMRAKHGLGGPKRHWRRFDAAWFAGLGVYRLSGRVRYGTAHAWR